LAEFCDPAVELGLGIAEKGGIGITAVEGVATDGLLGIGVVIDAAVRAALPYFTVLETFRREPVLQTRNNWISFPDDTPPSHHLLLGQVL